MFPMMTDSMVEINKFVKYDYLILGVCLGDIWRKTRHVLTNISDWENEKISKALRLLSYHHASKL